MAIRITKEPDSDDDESDWIRVAKMLIPFFAFFVLALGFGRAWDEWDDNTQGVVVFAIMLIAALVYRNELSEMLFKEADE